METEKYIFVDYRDSKYKSDPIFNTKSFTLYGNPQGFNNPVLFEVYLNEKRRFRYCLTNPKEVIANEEIICKIRRYLIAHEDNEDLENPINTYFIGQMEKSIDISSEFSNQTIVLLTYEMIEQWYPKNIDEIIKRVLEYVAKRQKYYGEKVNLFGLDDDVLFVDSSLNDIEKRDYKIFLRQSMDNEGLVESVPNSFDIGLVILTAKAVSLIQNKESNNNKKAFIAIKFNNNEQRINAIQNAISEAGFEPVIMNNLETNNWIMPEIFYQIKNSRFVVADFSIRCDGAYYEAGYAAALDVPVIHLFDKREQSETNYLHFDIAQKSTIFYETFEELKERLLKRIKATIK